MDSSDGLVVEATRHIPAGEEVTIRYGQYNNASLLVTYGFMLCGPGLHNSVDLKVLAYDVEVEVRVQPDGSLARRAALGPLFTAFQSACSNGADCSRTVDLLV